MRERSLKAYIETLALSRNKMVFLSGPRQVGKTTLAKKFIDKDENYLNWDFLQTRKAWLLGSDQIAKNLLEERKPRVVLDEFHKNKKWKTQLKGFFDQYDKNIQIILTGSAKLNTFRKGADSLLGRFIHFHLLPFCQGELMRVAPLSFKEFEIFLNKPSEITNHNLAQVREDMMSRLFKFGGFPEPFENQSEEFHRIWTKNRNELLIRQDVKELSNIFDIGHVELLASFLPDRVGSPLSIQSLREDLDIAHTTVSRWLLALSQVYYQFDLRPFSKSIPRSLKKEAKIYLYDWSDVQEKGPRFENMIACHLLKMMNFYNDTGQADLKLHYLRDKDGNEVDFLMTNKNKPLFSIEAKLGQRSLDTTYLRFQKRIRCPHFQIIMDKDFLRKHQNDAYVISFDLFFSNLP